MFRGPELMRLTGMIVLLLLVGSLIFRLRQPDTVQALESMLDAPEAAGEGPAEPSPVAEAGEASGKAGPAAPPGAPADAKNAARPLPPPTDEDPEEAEAIEYELQAVTDRTEWIQPEEMIPYNRIVQWVFNQTAAEMGKRARSDLELNDFIQSPWKYRGQLVAFNLNVRLVHKCPEPPAYPSPLFEVWGPTPESGSFLFAAIVVDLPEGMAVGRSLNERARFVGYFFKLQGYAPGAAKPGDRPLVAPMFIGRLAWVPSGRPGQGEEAGPWGAVFFGWGALAAIGLALALTVAIAWTAARRPKSRLHQHPAASRSEAPRLEQWLDRPEADPSPGLDPQNERYDN